MGLWKLGIIRGIFFGLLSTFAGIVLTMLVRAILGHSAWNAAQAMAVGTLTGVPSYLVGLGAFNYWLGWITGRQEEEHPAGQSRWSRYFSFDTNHKTIGVQYMVTSLLVIAVAGIYQLIARLETSQPGMQFMSLDRYNSLISLHGIMMLGAVLLGISGMINYLVPLMIGAKDMAFPRLNALSYWITPPAVLLLLLSLRAGGFDTGWTAYPP